jgi:excisionase family DNA binding protein
MYLTCTDNGSGKMQGLPRKPEPPAAAPRFYSVAQVARMFGMSSMTVYRAIAAGEFPAVRIRGRLIVPAKALDAMVEAAVAEQTVVDAAGYVPEGA